ncbi:MAG TPA: sensor domain-containing diguanylate cyclase [Myxococcota bacterium]|nr:sensor domain-containing diguanylate cyclase [Myxococcota bacterium]HRY94221.1 sensor domain-containing diguanylate cyclase [Myxococcota bacterium]HSA23911.1 sensor domain-containing diguanylate cyclase [Myxococcota bacterium]
MPTRSKQRRRGDPATDAPPAVRRGLDQVAQACLALGESLRKSRALESTLAAVTDTAVALTRSFQATLRLLDDSGKRLLTSARSGPSVHRRGNTPFRLGEGFIGWVAVHQKPAMINRVGRDPRFVHRPGQLWTPTALLAAPLLTPRGCIGVLSVARRGGAPFTNRDLALLRLVVQVSEPYLEIARLQRINESDPLTLLHNRRHLQERLPEEIGRAARRRRPLAAALLDLDRFKRVNDGHGHEVGDEVLVEFAERLRASSRATDVLARWGGEEFVVLLPRTTLAQASMVAERMRRAVADQPFQTSAGKLWVTLSAGVVAWRRGEGDASLLRRADQAMYAAKEAGRNRVETARG